MLQLLRHTIQKAVPAAEEKISYGMPAFYYHGSLAYFAAFKNHCSLFIRSAYLTHFKDELSAWQCTKATIHFPLHSKIPLRVVTKIVKFAAKKNVEKAKRKLK